MMQTHPAATLTLRLLPEADLEEAQEVFDAMFPEELEPGQLLIEEGTRCDGLFFVQEGCLAVEVAGDGGPVTVATIEPGHWVGEVGLLDPGPASATVRAAEATTVLHLSSEGLDSLRDANPDIVLEMLQTLSVELVERIRASNELLRSRLGVDSPQPSWFDGVLGLLFGNKEAP